MLMGGICELYYQGSEDEHVGVFYVDPGFRTANDIHYVQTGAFCSVKFFQAQAGARQDRLGRVILDSCCVWHETV